MGATMLKSTLLILAARVGDRAGAHKIHIGQEGQEWQEGQECSGLV